MAWTQETLRAWILGIDHQNSAHRAALSRALLFLYARQTEDEKQSGATSHNNGKGFSGIDAEFLTSVSKSVLKYGNMTPGQAPYVSKKLAKYTGQLLDMVNAQTAPATDTATATATDTQTEAAA